MNTLVIKYKQFTFAMFALALACQFLVITYVRPMVVQPVQALGPLGDILFFLSTWTVAYIFVFRLPVLIYEKWLWMLLYPSLHFGGVWRCVISYDTLAVPYGTVTSEKHLPDAWESFVEIQQTPFSMKMVEGCGCPGENWHSTSLDFKTPNGDTLWMGYEVTRAAEAVIHRLGFPRRSLGVKEIQVEKRDRRGRPINMCGDFYHAVLPDRPLFRGTTVFTRSTYAAREEFYKQRDAQREVRLREAEERRRKGTKGQDDEHLDRAA